MVGITRKEMSSEDLRASLMHGLRKFATRPVERRHRRQAALLRHRGQRRPVRSGVVRSAARAAGKARGQPQHRRQPAVLSGDAARRFRADRDRARPRRPAARGWRRLATAGGREAVRHRSRLRQGAERSSARASSPSTSCTGSIIISARRRCRTSWCCASPTACSSRSGTAITSTMSRSPSTRSSASAIAAASTTRPARCATWCRTICSSCCRWWRWSRRRISTRMRCAPPRPRCSTRDPACRAKTEALRNSVRGQYTAGKVGDTEIADYRSVKDVAPGQHHRDLCGAEADDRQLALGRRAVLSAHRQGARRQAHRGRDQVQAGAVRDVPRHPGAKNCRRTIW